jgi:hypothetical protein
MGLDEGGKSKDTDDRGEEVRVESLGVREGEFKLELA